MSTRPLAELFTSVRGRDEPCGDALESALQAALEAGRSAFPELQLDAAQWIRHLAAVVPFERELTEELAARCAADLYLACACTAGDRLALELFERRYLSLVPAFVARADLAGDGAAEIAQLLRERLFLAEPGRRARIADYSGRSPLGAWLRVVTARLVTDLHRQGRARSAAEASEPPASLPAIDPELDALRRRVGSAFQEAFAAAFGALSPRERMVLRLHFADGLNLDSIGLVLGLSRATAGRAMLSARTGLMEEVQRGLRARLLLSAAELESLLGVVRSKLEISLGGLLREPDAPAREDETG